MSVYLQIWDGKRKKKQYPIREGQNLIGRWDPTAGVFPEIDLDAIDEDARVSRKHATIEMSGDELSIIDMGSLNGTILNGAVQLEEGKVYPLQDGDQILIGRIALQVSWDE
ncbi:FHA domain-containing protein [bacterium]|nr:FHA domain-containing protein [bacterium]